MVMLDQMTTNLSRFESILKTGGPVYIVNNTDPRGQLVCTITDPFSGRSIPLNIQKTWLPYCLTDMLPREVIERSIQLRDHLRKGVLKIVDAEQANALLNSPRGQTEYNRLHSSKFAAGSNSDQQNALRNSVDANKTALNSLDNPNVAREEAQLHPRMRAWEQRITIGELDGNALCAELEIHRMELTIDDLRYLIAGNFPKDAKDWSTDALKSGEYRTSGVPLSVGGPKIQADSYEPDYD